MSLPLTERPLRWLLPLQKARRVLRGHRWEPRLVVLIGVVLAGFLIIVSLNPVLSVLHRDLEQRIANGHARLFVTEQLMRGVKDIEIETFRLATTMGLQAQDRIAEQLGQRIDGLERDLAVLRDGGSVRQSLPVTIDGADQVVREEHYSPDPGQSYVVEVIELGPQIDQIRERLIDLRAKIRLRDELRDGTDRDAFVAAEKAVKGFLKSLPTLFFRLHETASRHFVNTGNGVRQLEAEHAARHRVDEVAETLLIVFVIALVMAVGIILMRRIAQSTARLHGAHEAMRAAKDEAEAASRAKSAFVSRMSHELRTPLNAILGFAQLLKGQHLDAAHEVYLEEIDKAGAHLLDLINQVLDLAKVEAGRIELETVEFDPLRLLDEVTTVVAQRAQEKGLAVRAEVSPELPPQVVGDPTRLRQVLINLLGNGIKFTESGEIGLSAQPLDGGGRVKFRVWDTGPGIEPAVMGKLFQPFVQADTSTMRRFGGSGLGLTISKELVTAMGGEIEVESEVGRGSCFAFAIPLAPVAAAGPRPRPLSGSVCVVASADPALSVELASHLQALGAAPVLFDSATAASLQDTLADRLRLVIADFACRGVLDAPALRTASLRLLVAPAGDGAVTALPADARLIRQPVTYTRLADALLAPPSPGAGPKPAAPSGRLGASGARVLLVEDNPVNRLVAGAMLERLGLAFDWAGDGAEALDKLAQERFDLVLMDVEMPVMDGLAATRELRRREGASGGAHLPVIAMTANALAQDRACCIEAGMDAHLGKPVHLDDLEAMLGCWLGGSPPGAAASQTADHASAVPVRPTPPASPASRQADPATASQP